MANHCNRNNRERNPQSGNCPLGRQPPIVQGDERRDAGNHGCDMFGASLRYCGCYSTLNLIHTQKNDMDGNGDRVVTTNNADPITWRCIRHSARSEVAPRQTCLVLGWNRQSPWARQKLTRGSRTSQIELSSTDPFYYGLQLVGGLCWPYVVGIVD